MATKAKQVSVVGKEKKAPSSNSHITSIRKTPKLSTIRRSSTNKTTSTPSEKNTPSYLNPTISSRLEPSSSFKHPKSDAPNKPIPVRTKSLDKPLSSLNLTKTKETSLSRLHKALVSPGPKERRLGSSLVPAKSANLSKPISDRAAKILRDGKTSLSSYGSTKKADSDHGSANSTKPPKVSAETAQVSDVETEEVKEVKEVVTSEEVLEVLMEENEEHDGELLSEIPLIFECEHAIEHEQCLEGYDHAEPIKQADDEKVISTVLEELKEEPQEEKTKDDHEEEENTNLDDEEHSAAEEEAVINEKENEDGVTLTIEGHKSENNNEEEEVEEKKPIEGGVCDPVEEAKAEPTQQKQQLAVRGNGKREPQLSNYVIEETASKLMEEMNKVRALAGAFQTVIDNQISSI